MQPGIEICAPNKTLLISFENVVNLIIAKGVPL
jgi:hypothetical protein